MDIFLARQPIFDRDLQLVGYELLYRGSAVAGRAEGVSPDRMSSDVIVHAFLGAGLQRVTQGRPGFINFTREMLVQGVYELLPPEGIVVELLESIHVDEEVVEACRQLVDAGYRLALDDFEPGPAMRPLLEIAEIVKVDVLNRDPADLEPLVRELQPYDVQVLAERVETEAVREACARMGFVLFQGYFFSRPETLSHSEVPLEQLNALRLVQLLQDPDIHDEEVEEAFRSDVSLTYRLLRIVNSAALGGRGVRSIRHAVQLIGRYDLFRWLALLFVSSLAADTDTDLELVGSAIQRGRFCELLAQASGRPAASGPLFIVGLFSRLDALMRRPMSEILGLVDLSREVREALLARKGPYAAPLELAEAYEAGRWEEVLQLAARTGVPALEVPEIYLKSLDWARERGIGLSG